MTKQRATNEGPEAQSDPFEVWREFYEANEAVWSKAAKETTSTEAFAEMQGRMLETFLSFQKSARDAMNAQLATLNLPSRDDVARLGEIIVGLEEKIDRIEDRLRTLAPKPPTRTKATRSRRS